jgi:hypothetical protein
MSKSAHRTGLNAETRRLRRDWAGGFRSDLGSSRGSNVRSGWGSDQGSSEGSGYRGNEGSVSGSGEGSGNRGN